MAARKLPKEGTPEWTAAYAAWRADFLNLPKPEPFNGVDYFADLVERRNAVSIEGQDNAIKAAQRKRAIIKSRLGIR